MSDCQKTIIEILPNESIVEFNVTATGQIEFITNPTFIEFNDCPGEIIEITPETPLPQIVQLIEKQNIFIEPSPATIVEFPDCVVINNADVIPAIEEAGNIVDSFVASEQVFSNRAILLLSDGKIKHADKDDPIDFNDVIGVSANNGPIGALVKVVLFGKLKSANLGPITSTYWLGNSGQFLTTAPLSGVILHMATQTKANEISVDIGNPIRR